MSLGLPLDPATAHNGSLYGRDHTPNLVACEAEGPDRIRLFTREETGVSSRTIAFEPFLLLTDMDRLMGWGGDCRVEPLAGSARFRRLVRFPDFSALDSARAHLQKKSGKRLSAPGAAYLYLNDPVQQYLLVSGKTHFLGMCFSELRRMQIDLETYCDPRFEFPNPERESDRITAIAMSDTTGWERVIPGTKLDEGEMLEAMVEEIQRRDPDVLEGHNFFRFDLTYLRARARRYGRELILGRNGTPLTGKPARVEFGDRRLTFVNYEVFGRHIVDTWFLAQHYDLRTGDLEGHGLKDVARHFGVAAAGRTYIPGEKASWYFDREPETLFRYALDDVKETRAISAVLSPDYFIQAQIFPFAYQQVAVQDDVAKIDAFMLREYLAQRCSIPASMEAGGVCAEATSDLRFRGVERDVVHCRVTALEASIMLAHGYSPKSDALGALPRLLRELAHRAGQPGDREHAAERIESQALRTTCQALLGSVCGYLGSPLGHFNDFELEGLVGSAARSVTASLAEWLERWGARIIEVDVGGILFALRPPSGLSEARTGLERRLAELSPAPAALRVEGPYPALFSYAAKNHALLDEKGRMRVTGSTLYPRGLERFLRNCFEEMLRSLLEGKSHEVPVLYDRYRNALEAHELDISLLQKTETLQESLADYRMRVKAARRNPRGVYEIALRSGRDYLAGDQVSYYVTGEGAHVRLNEHCAPVADWDSRRPDENVEYYKVRLRDLYEKFRPFIAEGS